MTEKPAIESTRPGFPLTMPARFAVLAVVLFIEKVALSTLVDARRARDAGGLGGILHVAQHWGFRFLVTFLAALLVFALVKAKTVHTGRNLVGRFPNVSIRWMMTHVVLFASLAGLSYFLFSSAVTPIGFAAIATLWLVLAVLAIIAACFTLMPRDVWLQAIRSIGVGWLYAAAVGILGLSAWVESEKLWNWATAITFNLVTLVLHPLLPELSADPATRVVATPTFAVEITEVCSGLEGLGLTLAFSVVWLIYFRREYIFPRALILIPISLSAIFALNAFRIAALLLIGTVGYPEVALFGFHSQAGWIAFNLVACTLAFFSRRSPWLNRTASIAAKTTTSDNPTATYVVPLLAIMSAGTLSHAMSGRFETFYPIRLIAGLATLIIYRKSLRAICWRWTWHGPAVGIAVFLMWFVVSRWLLPSSSEPPSLAGMVPQAKTAWIASHFLVSIILVPIAEELAYRGFLMRRLSDVDFELVDYRLVKWPALTVAAVAFGSAHGTLWPAGIVAGMAYGMLAIRRGSLGQAVVAHSTTNGLIALTVVANDQWQLW